MATIHNIHDYQDILHLPHHRSKKYPAMPIADRAAQFAPFAALTGHQEAINETKRLTEPKRLLDEHQQEILNLKLQYLLDNIQTQPKVEIVYFKQDVKKDGGSYEKKVTQLKKIDEYEKKLILIDGSVVFIRDIYSIVL